MPSMLRSTTRVSIGFLSGFWRLRRNRDSSNQQKREGESMYKWIFLLLLLVQGIASAATITVRVTDADVNR
jgi:hypothetical protein